MTPGFCSIAGGASHVPGVITWGKAALRARIVVIAVFGLVLMLIGMLASLGVSALITAIENLGSGVGSDFVSDAALGLLRGWFTMMP
jgi:hypothetical protein